MRVTSPLITITSWYLTLSTPPLVAAKRARNADRSPVFAYSSSTSNHESGLEAGVFNNLVEAVSFEQGFHSCGTLLILSVPDLLLSDYDLLPKQRINATSGEKIGSGFKDFWEKSSRTERIKDGDAMDEQVVNWAKGWSETCPNMDYLNEVRIAKIPADLEKAHTVKERKSAVAKLDLSMGAHLMELPESPHPHLVILTAISPKLLMTMMDIASSTSHPPPKAYAPPNHLIFSGRHGSVFIFFANLFKFVFWLTVFGGAFVAVRQFLETRRMKKLGWAHVDRDVTA